MKKLTRNALAVSLSIVLIPSLAIADDDNDGDEKEYSVNMAPLNDSGVYAEIEMKLKGKKLEVEIKASGLEPGKIHPQHIHGHGTPPTNSTCPGPEADVDGDGVVSVGEGLPSYGPIMLPLVPFNLVDEAGNLDYEATFTINLGDLQPLHKRTVVMHGMTVNGSYIPSLPIACGEIFKED